MNNYLNKGKLRCNIPKQEKTQVQYLCCPDSTPNPPFQKSPSQSPKNPTLPPQTKFVIETEGRWPSAVCVCTACTRPVGLSSSLAVVHGTAVPNACAPRLSCSALACLGVALPRGSSSECCDSELVQTSKKKPRFRPRVKFSPTKRLQLRGKSVIPRTRS